MNALRDKVVLVTGGTGAIGRSVAARALAEGSRAVVVTGRDESRGRTVAEEVGAHFEPQDVTDEKRWAELVAGVVERFGRLDALVNNAGWVGTGAAQTPELADRDEWRRVLEVNLDGTFLGCRAALAVMRESGGSIVNISSTAGLMSTPSFVAYGAAKAAVAQFTKSVAVYCARHAIPVRCNSVHPALVDTPLADTILGLFDADLDRARSGYLARVPLGRLGTVDEVASAVIHLASDESSYVTGAQFVVGGGLGV